MIFLQSSCPKTKTVYCMKNSFSGFSNAHLPWGIIKGTLQETSWDRLHPRAKKTQPCMHNPSPIAYLTSISCRASNIPYYLFQSLFHCSSRQALRIMVWAEGFTEKRETPKQKEFVQDHTTNRQQTRAKIFISFLLQTYTYSQHYHYKYIYFL